LLLISCSITIAEAA